MGEHIDTNNQMPNGWTLIKLPAVAGDNGIFCDGDWIESKDQDKDGKIRLIQLADIGYGKFRDKSDRHLTHDRAIELNCTFLKGDDILIARMPEPLGRACIFPLKEENKYVTAVDVCILRVDRQVAYDKFICYIINSPNSRASIAKLESGTTRKRISRINLGTVDFPFPPLREQHRIVAKIEELFSELDKGVESLKTAQQQLKVYRQTVLKWAFEGKLTDAENQISIVPFGKIIKVVSGNTPKGLVEVSNKGKYQFYKVSDMNLEGNEVEMRTSKLCLTRAEIEKLRIKLYPKGTVIFPKRGGAILTNKKRILLTESSFDLNLMGALPNEKVTGEYLSYWFQKLDLGKIYDGSNVPQINNKNIMPLEFPICSIEQQEQIVQEIETRLSVADKLEETIAQSLQQAEALRQSILKKAFAGKLVPQDPSDEPASKLLVRIKVEKSAQTPIQKTRKKKANL